MMDRKEEKAFPEVLKETICAYKEDPAEDKFIDLLCLLWDGIEENGSVPVPAEMDWDKMTIRPSFRPREDGREALVALTVPDGERYPYFADVRLRAMVRIMLSMENCAGILFDPEEDTQMFSGRICLSAPSAQCSEYWKITRIDRKRVPTRQGKCVSVGPLTKRPFPG